MKFHSLFACLVAPCLVGSVQATVTVTVNSNGGPKYVTSTDQLLTAGASALRVGTFDISGGVGPLETSNDFATLDALFTPLIENEPGGGNINPTTQNHGDSSSHLHINDTASPGDVFAQLINISGTYLATGTQLYLWVFNHSDPTMASEWGIFSSTNVLWDFPPDNGSATLSTNSVDVIHRGNAGAAGLQLAAIPEPSGALLVGLAGFIVVCGRRRRTA